MTSKVTPYLVSVIFASVLGMFQFGWNTGVINAPQSEIEAFIGSIYPDKDSNGVNILFSIAVAAFIVGGMIGGAFGGHAAERFGRQRSLLYNQVFMVIGVILMASSKDAASLATLIIGRLCIGIGCGFFTGLVPLYVTEIAPVHLRGGLGTVNQLAVTCGILSAQIFGLNNVLGGSSWPILLSLSIIPCILQLILLPLCPESPKYVVVTRKDPDQGRIILTKLRGITDVEEELSTISMESSESEGSANIWNVLMSQHLRKPLLIAVLMHLSQQITGIVGIFFYSTRIFLNAGIPEKSAQFSTLGVGVIMVVMTLITIPLMDRVGRRPLHLIGMAGMTLACVLITIAFNVTEGDGKDTGSGLLAFLVISTLAFVVFFALGPGSIPWLITGELFATESRPAASAIVTLVNWTASLIVTLVFPRLQAGLQKLTFVPFGIILVVLFVPLFLLLPETKNRSIHEVLNLLERKQPGRSPKENAEYSQEVVDE